MPKPKTVKAISTHAVSLEEELPDDPVDFARKLKQLVSEDFSKSYRSVKRLVVKH